MMNLGLHVIVERDDRLRSIGTGKGQVNILVVQAQALGWW